MLKQEEAGGTSSPYGACRNAFHPDYIAGGSSSGLAVVVALGLVSFALGTHTVGSGRVPSAFNHLIAHKPTCGALFTRGIIRVRPRRLVHIRRAEGSRVLRQRRGEAAVRRGH